MFKHTNHNWASACLSVQRLIAEVDDQGGYTVEEGKHSDADIELSRGRVVSCQVMINGGGAIAGWDLVCSAHQPGRIKRLDEYQSRDPLMR